LEALRSLLFRNLLKQREQISLLQDGHGLEKDRVSISRLDAELNLTYALLDNGADKPHVVIMDALKMILAAKRTMIWNLASWDGEHPDEEPDGKPECSG
jgi:hypothetical protein